jgi:hypothetical protein
MKKIACLLFGWGFLLITGVQAGTSDSAVTSANVGQLINIELAEANALGDIRTTEHLNVHIMTLTVDNNDDDGYRLNFQSENGLTFGTGENFGYLIHASALDDTSVTPNEGQKPSARYELLLGENESTTEYGHTVRPDNITLDCTTPGNSASKFQISSNSGTDISFNNVSRATRSGVFNLCLTQPSDIQLFHGDFTDTIVVSISDN